MQIAIDGPASAGKSTIAKIVANKLNYVYIDTGAMYRAATLVALQHNVSLVDESGIVALIKQFPVTFKIEDQKQLVLVNDQDVSDQIRLPEITNNVSRVSALPQVRQLLVKQQQHLASQHSIVMDGRDIGTVVLPQADVKIFMVASVTERAQRRYQENTQRGIHTPLETLEDEISLRDYKDSHRKASPLKKATDALEIDTTGLNIEQVSQKVLKLIYNKTNI
ncbi:(d)CMP kinase [Bombilactobacillus thymidiniphilus]|uniref:Cytidylate kinase n=1 Tax=Bombilactobacillus thymidiniphilus TaxID=2923363 RepID=A0ABY4PD69_9LACO|nr:(d)CMP kinase [Bombilactobacillus thymidiniphilus]UQS83719.1 (d)CMP kinase [Bombilactobacillus thymidiniphilus]